MHSAVKLFIGLIILIFGITWYIPPFWANVLQIPSTFKAFEIVVGGLLGVVAIFIGLIIVWIEYEDLKWESKEKQKSAKKKV